MSMATFAPTANGRGFFVVVQPSAASQIKAWLYAHQKLTVSVR